MALMSLALGLVIGSALLERWLLMLKEQGEDAAFAQIRKELQDPNY